MMELVRAKVYYGPHAIGSVLLIHGQPYHYEDATQAKKAGDRINEFRGRLGKPPLEWNTGAFAAIQSLFKPCQPPNATAPDSSVPG